jgi:hypothetical protein
MFSSKYLSVALAITDQLTNSTVEKQRRKQFGVVGSTLFFITMIAVCYALATYWAVKANLQVTLADLNGPIGERLDHFRVNVIIIQIGVSLASLLAIIYGQLRVYQAGMDTKFVINKKKILLNLTQTVTFILVSIVLVLTVYYAQELPTLLMRVPLAIGLIALLLTIG